MKEKILASFVLAMLLAAILTLYASIGTVESASFLDFNFHDPDGAFSPQDLSINSVPPPTEWNKTYGEAEADRAYHVIETSDGGYALAGCTGSFGVGNYDFWLVKTDSTGNMQWNKTYGGPNNDIARSIVQTPDGGYAMAGYTASYGAGDYDFWLVKVETEAEEVHNVAVTNVAPSKTVVGQGFTLDINVTVKTLEPILKLSA